jgi:hypothetical protein
VWLLLSNHLARACYCKVLKPTILWGPHKVAFRRVCCIYMFMVRANACMLQRLTRAISRRIGWACREFEVAVTEIDASIYTHLLMQISINLCAVHICCCSFPRRLAAVSHHQQYQHVFCCEQQAVWFQNPRSLVPC